MHKQKTNGFTLVELIVVITILAILGTIAFISLQGYSSQARDSTRISDLSSMKSSLELFNIDAGKYPLPSDVTEITYSGAVAWSQGTFGETVFSNVDKLDKIPTDPQTDKQYVYSTTSTRTEYQLVGAFESDNVSMNNEQGIMNNVASSPLTRVQSLAGRGELRGVLNTETNAAEKTAIAKITGTYNGKLLKVQSGSTTYILAMPSILSATGATVEEIVTNNELVYNGYKNLPYQYNGNYKTKGETALNLVNAGNILVYSGDVTILSESSSTGTLARKTMLENLQTAYSGSTISSIGEISQLLNTDTNDATQTEYITTYLVKNDLGGSVKVTSPGNTNNNNTTTTYSNCTATTQSGYTIPQIDHGINNQLVTKTISYGTQEIEVSCNDGTLSYGTETINCENNYILSGESCVLDTCTGTMPDYAELNGTQGTSSWTYSISPGTCKYQCQTGYHTENGGTTCTSDTQSCVISNATAEQTWNGSSWGTCTVVTCNANYTQSGNSCNINTYIVSGSFGANAAGATISVCGTNVTADGSGNFSTTRNHGSTCNNISATRSEYTCTTSTNGPASLTSNTTNISGSCSLSSNTSCKGLYDGGNTTDGIYTIDPDGAGSISSFSTYCDMTNGGWTLVSMERASGTSVDGAVGAIGSFTSLNQTTSFKITDEAWKAIPFTIGTKIVREDGIIYYVKYGSFPWSSSLDTGVNPGTGNNPIPSCSINGTSWVAGRYYHIADCYNAYRTEDIYSYGAGRASINCSYSFTDTHKYLACKNRTTIGNSGNNRTAWVK